MVIVFDEELHPRDRLGRFRGKLGFDLGIGEAFRNLTDGEAREAWDGWASSLSTDIDFDANDYGERGAFENYANYATTSAEINNLMRHGTVNEDLTDPEQIKVEARHMSDAIGRTEVPENVIAYRFFEDDELVQLAKEGNIVGTRISDSGFMSTSLDTHLMREAGFTGKPLEADELSDVSAGEIDKDGPVSIISTIRVPKGAKGAYMNASGITDEEAQAGFWRKGGLSPFPDEQELVLGDGTTAEITSARWDAETEALLITMDVVQQLGSVAGGRVDEA